MRLLLIVLLNISLFGSDLWQVDFANGASIYNIENAKKQRLSFECGYNGGSIILYNKNQEITIKDNEIVNFIINDEKKLSTLNRISLSKTMNDTISWGNLVYEIPSAKKIIVETNNQKFTFEPSNLKELQYFIEACTEYEKSEDTTSGNSSNTTSANTTTSAINSNKQPFKFDIKTEYSPSYQMTYPLLIITSLDDRLIIKDVKINKGKCNAIPISERKQNINGRVIVTVDRAKLPVSVPEFEALKVNIASGCNILRLDIDTDAGIWSFGE